MPRKDYARSRRIAQAAEEVRRILYGIMLLLKYRRSRPEILADLTAAAGALDEVDLCSYGPAQDIPDWIRRLRTRNDREMDAALERFEVALEKLYRTVKGDEEREYYVAVAQGFVVNAREQLSDFPWLEPDDWQ